MILLTCPACHQTYGVADDMAGKKARCAGCWHQLIVPPPAPREVTISFACDGCWESYSAPENKAGKRTKCPRCGKGLVVPQMAVQKVPPPPPETVSPKTGPGRTPTEERAGSAANEPVVKLWTSSDPGSRPTLSTATEKESGVPELPALQRTTKAALFLWVVGAILLLVAWRVSSRLDEQDLRALEAANSFGRVRIALGDFSDGRPIVQADRTPVYLLAGLGAIFVALGVVCWAFGREDKPDEPGASSPASPGHRSP